MQQFSINFNVPLDQRKQNALICLGCNATLDVLLGFGFWQVKPGCFYYCVSVGDEISFNVSIDGGRIRINVLDDMFCQPYDYQAFLREYLETGESFNQFAFDVHVKVQKIMAKLLDAEIVSGYVLGDYI